MARFPQFPNGPFGPGQSAPGRPQVLPYGTDESTVGSFMNAVYAWMAVGLATTAAVAYYISSQPQVRDAVWGNGILLIGLLIAELVLVGVISAAVQRISAGVATALFILYAALNG